MKLWVERDPGAWAIQGPPVSVGAFSVAVSMVVPTLIKHGTEQQKKEHVDAIRDQVVVGVRERAVVRVKGREIERVFCSAARTA